MDSSNSQHHQSEMSSQTLESMLVCTKAQQDKKPRPPEQALKCPRCDSTNTKFCYYNNYSLTQPRYFCKSCRRYWTKGGTLRNVPVGGGCRKNRRSASSSSSSTSSKKGQEPNPFQPNMNPISSLTSMPYDSDISLALARLQKQHSVNGGGNMFDQDHQPVDLHMMQQQQQNPSFFDALRGGFVESNQNSGYQNQLYYGNSSGNVGLNLGHDQEMTSAMVGYEQEMNVKQEMSNAAGRGAENLGGDVSSRVLWGFPWQVNAGDVSNGGVGGGGHGGGGGYDHSGRQQMMSSSWNNGFGASNWQGLLNSAPLM